MIRFTLYGLVALIGLGVLVYLTVAAPIAGVRYNTVRTESPYDVSVRARAIRDTLMVTDLHNDLLLWPRDPRQRHDRGHSGIPVSATAE